MNYLKRSKARKWKQGGEKTGSDASGGGSGDVNRVHERLSMNAAYKTHHINNHNLTQSNPFSQHMAGTRQHHHNRSQRHRQSRRFVREFCWSDEPKHRHRRTYRLQRGAQRQPAAADGVAQSGVCHYEDGSDVGECWKGYQAADGFWTVEGGDGDYSTGHRRAATGSEARDPQRHYEEDIVAVM